MIDLDRYLIERPGQGCDRWVYRFPNGREADVVLDPTTPLRLTVEYPGDDGYFIAVGLTTDQAETKLAEIFALGPVDSEAT